MPQFFSTVFLAEQTLAFHQDFSGHLKGETYAILPVNSHLSNFSFQLEQSKSPHHGDCTRLDEILADAKAIKYKSAENTLQFYLLHTSGRDEVARSYDLVLKDNAQVERGRSGPSCGNTRETEVGMLPNELLTVVIYHETHAMILLDYEILEMHSGNRVVEL